MSSSSVGWKRKPGGKCASLLVVLVVVVVVLLMWWWLYVLAAYSVDFGQKHVPNTNTAAYICCPEYCKEWSSYPTWRCLCFNSGDFFPLRKYFHGSTFLK
jgi:hypothetical protein